MEENRSLRWQQIVARVAAEYQLLPELEKQWIAERIEKIAHLQRQLNQLFEQGSGVKSCCVCEGDCCAKGHNHMTLVNLLSFIQHHKLPPDADFSRSCPFLSSQGCLLPIDSRPYNCVSFICDTIEDALSESETLRFYALEKQLRGLYLDFASRYPGAAMTGLLLQDQRLSGRPFFAVN